MQILILIVSAAVVRPDIVETGHPCNPKTRPVTCSIESVNSKSLREVPRNCTVLVGDLLIESMTVLPKEISVLSNLWFIKGALIVRNTNFYVVNFTFLNNVRCIESEDDSWCCPPATRLLITGRHSTHHRIPASPSPAGGFATPATDRERAHVRPVLSTMNPSQIMGPAVILEENFNLHTLGLESVKYIAGDGEPVFSMVGDSYLYLATDKELKKLITAASVDGHYHDGLFSVTEIKESSENTIFYICFFLVCSVVVLIIVAGHIVFQIHIPKGTESGRSIAKSSSIISSSRLVRILFLQITLLDCLLDMLYNFQWLTQPMRRELHGQNEKSSPVSGQYYRNI
ncbi:hypothetical protein Y032_0002g937 [Ancylostoma ceylanicum]|uniref:Receptor L-domain domain-containing protein n=1 Tax=Ancylostoma ceylanicum TaxID=53326 RepID=A0A016W226_9BILA|nr:hypothetical protein Y032_0002g937 [Ancylostoma ceylanicum]